ncbi:hypothetical protein DTO207G8_3370 [Paecilomyces variotii]|nr:hypothetical protein DTO207G8_3370 [Paecilomyces variotii]
METSAAEKPSRGLGGASTTIFVVTLVLFVISFISVCLRCFVRLRLVRAFGYDDGLMILALALNIWFAICGMTGSFYGFAKRFTQIPEQDIRTALMWWWLGQVSYVLTCVVAKISIALSIMRLTVKRVHSIVLWAVISVTTIVGLVFWLMLTLQCRPVAFFWNRTGNGHCLSSDSIITMAYVYSVEAAVCDFTVGILPVFVIWNLQMNRRTKWAVAGILSMGCVASAAVVIRIPFLHHYKDPDFLHATASISIWSNVEASLGITAGSLITLRPLFRFFRGGSLSGTRSGKKTKDSMQLSEFGAHGPTSSFKRYKGPGYWRPDVDPDESHVVVTTGNPSRRHYRQTSKNSSQEDLNPKGGGEDSHGVAVQKTFVVTSDELV